MLKTQEERRSAMQELPVPRLIPEMALPAIVAFLTTAVYILADTYFVSSLGTNATAAVSVNASLDQILIMAGSLLAIGANSYISRLLGAKRNEYASRVLSTAFFLAAGIGILVMLPSLLFIHPLVRLLGATSTCENYAVEYAAYILLVAPVMTCSFVMNQSLWAEGSAMLSMIGMGFGGILNCLIDPIFIFKLEMGVAGASVATALSKVVSASIMLFPYVTHRSLLRLSIWTFRPNRDILTEIIAVGSSSMLRSGLAAASAVMLNNLAGNLSDSLLTGLGVATKVMMFPFGIILGFGTGFQPVVGFSLGAKRYDRFMESCRFASKMTLVGAGVIWLGLGFFSGSLISLFGESDVTM